MGKFVCTKCKAVVDELPTTTQLHPYGDREVEEVVQIWEHECGGDFDIGKKCPVCEEWKPEDDVSACCEICKEEILTPEMALEYIKEKECEQDFFVEFWTGATVSEHTKHLTGICQKDWDFVYTSNDPEQAIKSLFSFIDDDFDHFFTWWHKKQEEGDKSNE